MEKNTNFTQVLHKILSKHDYKKIKEIIDYNHTNGKNLRSFIFNKTLYKFTQTNNNLIGDIIEILQTSFLIIDDIMDNSTIRRNKKCWYLVNGLQSVKDGSVIISLIYKVLVEVVADITLQYEIIEFFNDIIFKTCVGQCEDLILPEVFSWIDIIECVNRANYESICFKKTGYYTFYLPIKLGYIFSGKDEPFFLKELCELFGLYYQIYDDYLDFFPEKSGKIGFDIEDRKLTWITCRIVDKGYDEELIKYYQGNNTNVMKERSLKFLDYYNEEILEAKRRIESLRCEGSNWLIEMFYELCFKLIKV